MNADQFRGRLEEILGRFEELLGLAIGSRPLIERGRIALALGVARAKFGDVKEAVRKRHELDLSHAAVQHDDPERAFLIRTTVWRALDYLPPRRRAVVVMYELEGLSMASIASLLGINAITVRWHLSRGRRELARRLRPQLGEIDEQPQNSLAERRPASSRSSAP